ncbi:MAG: hypothetical protein CL466_08400 [Acidimicrobiaceae bacterium]|nr:hypothetical protein [Acidimicrobiaceae bacterium]
MAWARDEAGRLRRAIDRDLDRFVLVFDTEVTGLGYGDLLHMLGVARFVVAHDVRTEFVFVEPGADWSGRSDAASDVDELLDDFIGIVSALLDPEVGRARRVSPDDLPSVLEGHGRTHVLFEDFVRDRRPFFRDCANVFNVLMAEADGGVVDRTLFSPAEFEPHRPSGFDIGPYVSWQCRYSRLGIDEGRRATSDEFIAGYEYLQRRFPDHRILVVSDESGCRHYRDLVGELDIDDVAFSKPESPGFLSDAALVMASDFFFWFRAGGMCIIPFFSRLPYEALGPVMNEMMWDEERLTPWQEPTQTFIELEKHQFVADRTLDVALIGSRWDGQPNRFMSDGRGDRGVRP